MSTPALSTPANSAFLYWYLTVSVFIKSAINYNSYFVSHNLALRIVLVLVLVLACQVLYVLVLVFGPLVLYLLVEYLIQD